MENVLEQIKDLSLYQNTLDYVMQSTLIGMHIQILVLVVCVPILLNCYKYKVWRADDWDEERQIIRMILGIIAIAFGLTALIMFFNSIYNIWAINAHPDVIVFKTLMSGV